MVIARDKESQKSAVRREQRKEKSRNAARCRRKNESESYQSLIKLLPIQSEVLANIDQGSGLCLVNRFIQLRSFLPDCIRKGIKWNTQLSYNLFGEKDCFVGMEEQLNAIDGFMLIIDCKFKALFVSQNAKEHLGVNETDIIGQNFLRSLIHQGDHDQVSEFFAKTHDKDNVNNLKRLFCRLKTSFEVGRNGKKFKTGTGYFQTFHCTFIEFEKSESKCEQLYGVFVKSIPLPNPRTINSFLSSSFSTLHSLDFKFIRNDEFKLSSIIGYDKSDLIGDSFFQYFHPLDVSKAAQALENMTKWRQVEFGPYRFLCKEGGWVVLVTQATKIDGQKDEVDTIVCVHYICGSVENKEVVMTSQQASPHRQKNDGESVTDNKILVECERKLMGPLDIQNCYYEEFADNIVTKTGAEGDTWDGYNKELKDKKEKNDDAVYLSGDNDPPLCSATVDDENLFPKNGCEQNQEQQQLGNYDGTFYDNYDDSEMYLCNAPSIGDPYYFSNDVTDTHPSEFYHAAEIEAMVTQPSSRYYQQTDVVVDQVGDDKKSNDNTRKKSNDSAYYGSPHHENGANSLCLPVNESYLTDHAEQMAKDGSYYMCEVKLSDDPQQLESAACRNLKRHANNNNNATSYVAFTETRMKKAAKRPKSMYEPRLTTAIDPSFDARIFKGEMRGRKHFCVDEAKLTTSPNVAVVHQKNKNQIDRLPPTGFIGNNSIRKSAENQAKCVEKIEPFEIEGGGGKGDPIFGTGDQWNYPYYIQQNNKVNKKMSLELEGLLGTPQLPEISLHDCEVNAPCAIQALLTGPVSLLLDSK